MALPKFEVSTYDIKLPISQLDIKYRPYLVKEEKNLMIANETGEQKDVINAVKNLIDNCTNNTLKSGVIPMADLEYLFVNIRAKSSGETTKVSIKCPDEENTYVTKEIKLTDLQVDKPLPDSNLVRIDDNVAIEFRYPSIDDLSHLKDFKSPTMDDLFQIIINCVHRVIDGEKVYEKTDFNDKESKDFIESLSSSQFNKVRTFFDSIPKLYKDVEVNNPNTNVSSTVRLEGLNSFFI